MADSEEIVTYPPGSPVTAEETAATPPPPKPRPRPTK
jgi:hypothetical protein